jgi:hypothetical protein
MTDAKCKMCRRWGVQWTIVMSDESDWGQIDADAIACDRRRFRQSLMQPLIAGRAFRWDHRQQTGSSSIQYEGEEKIQ